MILNMGILRSSILASLEHIYVAFYIDWIHQFMVCLIYYTFALASVLIFVGLCLYIEAMAIDLRLKLVQIDENWKGNWCGVERALLEEIKFHRNILQLRN